MWGRKAKLIKELEGEIKKHEVVLFDKIDAILRMNVTIDENKDTITHLEIALRDAEESMDLLRAQPATEVTKEVTKEVTTEPLEWIAVALVIKKEK